MALLNLTQLFKNVITSGLVTVTREQQQSYGSSSSGFARLADNSHTARHTTLLLNTSTCILPTFNERHLLLNTPALLFLCGVSVTS